MPNKTIYVSDGDIQLFEEAKEIAGEALSSVISRALREYITRHTKKNQGMKEISIKVGRGNAEQEKRFVGSKIGDWRGFDDDQEWWMEAGIYLTQKNNWAIHLQTICKASLLLNKALWKASGDYLVDARSEDLLVGSTLKDFKGKIPTELYKTVESLIDKNEAPIEYLDI